MPAVGDKLIFNQNITFRTLKEDEKGIKFYAKLFTRKLQTVELVVGLTYPEIREIKQGDELTIKSIDKKGITMTSKTGKVYGLNCWGAPSCSIAHLEVLFEKPKRCETYDVTPTYDENQTRPESPVEI